MSSRKPTQEKPNPYASRRFAAARADPRWKGYGLALKEIAKQVEADPDLRATVLGLFFGGSRAVGFAHEKSDADIFVVHSGLPDEAYQRLRDICSQSFGKIGVANAQVHPVMHQLTAAAVESGPGSADLGHRLLPYFLLSFGRSNRATPLALQMMIRGGMPEKTWEAVRSFYEKSVLVPEGKTSTGGERGPRFLRASGLGGEGLNRRKQQNLPSFREACKIYKVEYKA